MPGILWKSASIIYSFSFMLLLIAVWMSSLQRALMQQLSRRFWPLNQKTTVAEGHFHPPLPSPLSPHGLSLLIWVCLCLTVVWHCITIAVCLWECLYSVVLTCFAFQELLISEQEHASDNKVSQICFDSSRMCIFLWKKKSLCRASGVPQTFRARSPRIIGLWVGRICPPSPTLTHDTSGLTELAVGNISCWREIQAVDAN